MHCFCRLHLPPSPLEEAKERALLGGRGRHQHLHLVVVHDGDLQPQVVFLSRPTSVKFAWEGP